MGDFKKIVRTRLLDEMLGQAKAAGAADWSVLIMDATTTRVMSAACRISEILDYGISLVENIAKRREPLPSLSGIYFISPTEGSITRLLDDFSKTPLYKTAHVFFSSKVSKNAIAAIKGSAGLVPRLKTLIEVNFELIMVDKRTFTTDEERSLQTLFGPAPDAASGQQQTALIATRLATAFATLQEFPIVRFRAAKPPDAENVSLGSGALVAQRVAVEVHERLSMMQREGRLPAQETCDLLIFDRGFDPVAPVIHEWTYEAMAYDLLNMKGDIFKYESETQGGKIEQKEHRLNENDDMWQNLRHKHFAAASLQISQMLDDFRARNKAASYQKTANGDALDMRNMRSLVASLPQYREQLARLNVHVELASHINKALDEKSLTDLGKLEQDLVFGDATSKEVISYLSSSAAANLPAEDKVRLLMCYVATHPEKMDDTKAGQWQKLAKLSTHDMETITNLEYLGVPVRKRGKTPTLMFGRKRKRAVRKDRDGEDDAQYNLSRFVPLLQEVVEDLSTNRLSTDEYPYVQPPSSQSMSPLSAGLSSASASASAAKVGSVRTNRATAGWTKRAGSAGLRGGDETPTSPAAFNPKGQARRIVVFVVGGVTRSEIRVAHKLSARLGKEIILGGTTADIPSAFVKGLAAMQVQPHVSLEMDYNE